MQTQGDGTANDAQPRRAGRPTMVDVAAHVGVSRALVSLVFRDQPGASEETRAKVFAAAQELGYRPDSAARVLARTRSKMLGVLVTVRNPYHADLVEGIYPVAEDLGYDIVLSATAPSRDVHKAIESLIGHRCEGLILLGPDDVDRDYLSALAHRTPVVVLGRRFPGAGVDSVHTAEGKGVRQAVDHLVRLGHTAITHIDGGTGAGSAERRRAYRAAMRRHGLAHAVDIVPGDQTEESGARAARAWLAEPGRMPTAVLAGNDRCAFGVLDTVWRAGLEVPGDLSVVGYDDSALAHLSHIDLTTVRQDPDRQAELAVRCIVERLDGARSEVREIVLEPTLVTRGTTGPPGSGHARLSAGG